MKREGKLEYRDIGAGQWLLHTDTGPVMLFGDIDAALDGAQVQVDGDAVDGASAAMLSDQAMTVRAVRAVG